MTVFSRFVLVTLAVIPLAACTSSGRVSPAAQDTEGSTAQAASEQGGLVPAVVGLPPEPVDAAYRIGPQDLVEVEVFQVPELTGKRRVSDRGQIILPLIGAVQVGGLTPEEAEQALAEALGKSYLENPQVSVFVADYASQNITVTGSVKKPGVFPLKGNTTLLQAVAQAEGLDRLANDNEVIIFRSLPGESPRGYIVDLEKIHKGKLPDPVLVANDRIVVPESGTAVLVKGLSDTLRGFVRLPFY